MIPVSTTLCSFLDSCVLFPFTPFILMRWVSLLLRTAFFQVKFQCPGPLFLLLLLSKEFFVRFLEFLNLYSKLISIFLAFDFFFFYLLLSFDKKIMDFFLLLIACFIIFFSATPVGGGAVGGDAWGRSGRLAELSLDAAEFTGGEKGRVEETREKGKRGRR